MPAATQETAPPAAAPAVKIIAPPLDRWVSPALLSFIDTTPNNPAIRGLVRAELNLVPPRSDTGMTAEVIKAFLGDNFHRSRPYEEQLKPYYAGSRDGKPTTPIPSLFAGGRAQSVPVPMPEPARTAAQATPVARLNDDGSFTMTGLRVVGIERGTVEYVTQVTYTGGMRIPAGVVTGGQQAIDTYIREHLSELDENAENFFYGGGPDDNRWHPTGIEISELTADFNAAAEALARR